MKQLSRKTIAAEMAWRKIQFHPKEKWDEIELWGPFNYRDISTAIMEGWLINIRYSKPDINIRYMTPENVIWWVSPSKEFWENDIKPLLAQHSLEELQKLAGIDPKGILTQYQLVTRWKP